MEATRPSGPLLKKRRTLSWFKVKWQERNFELEEGCTVQPLYNKDKPGKCLFEVRHPRRKSLTLAAGNPEQRDAWVNAIQELIEQEDDSDVDDGGDVTTLVPSHLKERYDQCYKLVNDVGLKEEGWTLQFEKKGVKAYRAVQDGITCSKGVGVVNHHPISILLAIMDYTVALEADPDLDQCKRVDVSNSHTFLDYFVYKGVWPVVAPRDMYIANTWQILPDGDLLFTAYSEADGLHSEEKGIVRAFCPAVGWLIHPLDAAGTSCEVTYFAMVDLRGNIPKALVDKANENQALEVAAVGELLDKDKKEGKGHYEVDTTLSKDKLTDKNVVPYIHRLHRRTLPNWEKYQWLKGDEAKFTASNSCTTASGTITRNEAIPTLEGDQAAPPALSDALVKKSPQGIITAFILLIVAAIQIRLQY